MTTLASQSPTTAATLPAAAPTRLSGLRDKISVTGTRRFGIAIPLSVYLLTAVIFTWPLVLHIGSSLYLSPARPFGDYTGTLANLQSLLHGPHFPFLPGHNGDFNAPAGLPVNWELNLVTFPEVTILFLLGLVFGATAAVDLFILIGFIASGMAMFGLVRSVTRRPVVALLAGWAFAFYPYAVANGEHPDYIHGWPLVLILWAGLRAVENPTRRNGAIAGAAAVVGMAWTAYYILLGGLLFAAVVAAALFIGLAERRLRAQIVAFGIASAIALSFVAVVLALSVVNPAAGGHAVNTLVDVTQQSARPINYALAPAWNFLLGSVTGPTLVAHGWNFTEKTLYLGLSLLALSAVAVVMAALSRLPASQVRAVVVAAAVGFVAFLCSLAPDWHVAGYVVHMPSWYLFHVTNGFRIYERLVIVVELAVCVLASVGLASLLPRGRPTHAGLIVAIAAAVVVCDLWAPIPSHFERVSIPAIYKVLAKQPPGIYADYPLGPAGVRPDYHDLFYQGHANHPVLNGYAAGSVDDARAQSLSDPSISWVGGTLAYLGVRYVLVERHPLAPFVASPLPGRGFVVLARDDYGTLYRNDNPPTGLIEPVDGFSDAEGPASGQVRWIDEPTARLRISARCSPCNGELRFGAVSFGRPRLLTVQDAASGRVLIRRTIASDPVTLQIKLRFSRQTTLIIATVPGPQSIAATIHSLDQRHVSVQVRAPQFTRASWKTSATW